METKEILLFLLKREMANVNKIKELATILINNNVSIDDNGKDINDLIIPTFGHTGHLSYEYTKLQNNISTIEKQLSKDNKNLDLNNQLNKMKKELKFLKSMRLLALEYTGQYI